MKPMITAMFLCATLCAPVAALAGGGQTAPSPQAGAAMRIRQGVRAGDLTRGETGRLRSRLAALRTIAASWRGGGLNARERQLLGHLRRDLSRQIFRLRHNDIRRSRR